MHRKQQGLSMIGFLLVAVVLVIGAVGGMKIGPAYAEYFSAKKAVMAVLGSGDSRSATVAELRKSFDRRAGIDNVTIISGADLEITKEGGGEVVITFAYPKKVPLVGNLSLLIEFAFNSQK